MDDTIGVLVAAGFKVIRDLLAVVEVGQTCALKRGNVDEHVLGTTLGLDEAETLGRVEPFHGAFGHRDVSYSVAARIVRQPGAVRA